MAYQIDPETLQDAVALLTMTVTRDLDEFPAFMLQVFERRRPDEIVLALLAVARTLCFVAGNGVATMAGGAESVADLDEATKTMYAQRILQKVATDLARNLGGAS